MKTVAHQYEDKLLEFAYGEVDGSEAAAIDAHVRSCERCSKSLADIRAVRSTMQQLPQVSAPDAGLESLLAYAEQTAKRNAEDAKPKRSPWLRWLTGFASVAALSIVGVVAYRAQDELSPVSAAVQAKQERDVLAKAEGAPAASAPVAAAAPADSNADVAQANKRERESDRLAANELKEDAKKLVAPKSDAPKPEPKTQALRDEANYGDARTRVMSKKKVDEGYASKAALPRKGGADGEFAAVDAKPTAAPPPPAVWDVKEKQAATEEAPREQLAYQQAAPSAPSTKPAPAPTKAPQKVLAAAEPNSMSNAMPSGSSFGLSGPSNAPLGTGSGSSAGRGSIALGGKADLDAAKAADKYESTADDVRAEQAERSKQVAKEQLISQKLNQARAASANGDSSTAVQFYAAALEAGAAGKARLEALQGACSGLESLGRTASADPYCDALLNEFPASVAARQLTVRRGAVQGASPVGASKASEKKATAIDSAAEAR